MILDEIAAKTIKRVEELKRKVPLKELKSKVADMDLMTGFPFEQAMRKEGLSFILEVKKASPSKGVIVEEFPYVEIAKEYEAAGASAISVLTEPYFFQGKNEYLTEIKRGVSIPVLRKDFTVDEYMIYEAKAMRADAVLLICAILTDTQLKEYRALAESLGMTALIEAHDEKEVTRGLQAGAKVLGVNNRNLKDFTVSISNSIQLRGMVPKEVAFISESGIKSSWDTASLYTNGTDGVLIGETLMRSENKRAMMDQLRNV